MSRSNAQFTHSFFIASALIGSLSAVLLVGAFVWAVIRLGLGNFSVSANNYVRLIAATFALYPASEFISVIANGRGFAGIFESLGAVLCLAVLPVASRLMVSSADEIANSAARGAAISGIITLLICLVQMVILIGYRPTGGSANTSVLAFFAVTLFCICCSLSSIVSSQYRKLVALGALSCFCTIILTDTRAAWVGAALVLPVALWPIRHSLWNSIIRLGVFKQLIFASIVLCVLIFGAWPRLEATIQSFEGFRLLSKDVSIAHRIFIWSGGIQQFLASPVFGYGPDTPRQMITALGGNPPLTYTHYHNIFLTAAIRGGLVEVIALVLIFAGLFWVAFKKHHNQIQRAGQTLLIALSIAALSQGMAGVLFTHDITSAMFIFTAVIGLCLSVHEQSIPA